MNTEHRVMVCALYNFTPIENPTALQSVLLERLKSGGILGTILVAPEGINGTISGPQGEMDAFLDWLDSQRELAGADRKISWTHTPPFKRTRVKLKKEIVTMGVADIDPRASAGTYVEPEDWNQIIDDPGTLVVDTRNEYEIRVGSFEGALNPHTTNFREFPDFASNKLDTSGYERVAMFCTGGIRCEKSTAYLREMGLDNVYHLKGGILNYLEKVPPSETRWRGECFVFDERVTVDHDLQKGSYDQCHACREPITDEDKSSEYYQPGVSCPYCHDRTSDADKARYAEREKQVTLAEQRGLNHIGPD